MPSATGRLKWDKSGERKKSEGCDHGVLYPIVKGQYTKGIVWNGLTQVTLSPDGAEATDLWADNIKYMVLYSAESFSYTIEAYFSPEEFDACDGMAEAAPGVNLGQQARQSFGFSYRSGITNDTEGADYGYKIHLIYNSKASPSETNDATKSDSPNTDSLSWECTTIPIAVDRTDANGKEYAPVAHIEIDSTKVSDKSKLKAFEDIIYGTDAAGDTPATDSRLPLPEEVIDFFKAEG